MTPNMHKNNTEMKKRVCLDLTLRPPPFFDYLSWINKNCLRPLFYQNRRIYARGRRFLYGQNKNLQGHNSDPKGHLQDQKWTRTAVGACGKRRVGLPC